MSLVKLKEIKNLPAFCAREVNGAAADDEREKSNFLMTRIWRWPERLLEKIYCWRNEKKIIGFCVLKGEPFCGVIFKVEKL